MIQRLFTLVTALLLTTAAWAQGDGLLLGIVSISRHRSQQRPLHPGRHGARPMNSAGDVRSSTPREPPTRRIPRSRTSLNRAPSAIVDMVFPGRRIGAGLAAAERRRHPGRSRWGGGLGRAGVAATNGSGGPMVVPVNELMVENMGGTGSILALTYHTGEVCRNARKRLDQVARGLPEHHRDQERGPHPRLLRGRRAVRHRLARLAPRRSANRCHLGLLGRPGDRRHRALRQQGRDDVLVYGVNGNAEAPRGTERLHDRHRVAGQLRRGQAPSSGRSRKPSTRSRPVAPSNRSRSRSKRSSSTPTRSMGSSRSTRKPSGTDPSVVRPSTRRGHHACVPGHPRGGR